MKNSEIIIPVELNKKGKITFNESGQKSMSGRLTIPVDILKLMNINKHERNVSMTFIDGKLIIEKDTNTNY